MFTVSVALAYVFVIAFGATAIWAFYYWWQKKKHTRERFAFFGLAALFNFAFILVFSIVGKNTFFALLLSELAKPFGFSFIAKPIPTPLAVVLTLLLLALVYAYVNIFKSWDGKKSIAQHEQEQNRDRDALLKAVVLLIRSDKNLAEYQEDGHQHQTVFGQIETKAWHIRACELVELKHRHIKFNKEGYFQELKCYFGKDKNTDSFVTLACFHQLPTHAQMGDLLLYTQRFASKQELENIEVIVAFKGNLLADASFTDHYLVKQTNEEELLTDLVDFSDYFAHIKEQVEKQKLIDSDFTLQDTYTPSFYSKEEKGKPEKETLESFVYDWLNESTRRQLAVLGEYGQGKSTGSLLLSYNLINQLKFDSSTRIPILIELRGRTVRTTEAKELLAMFGDKYHISGQALYHLHLAGKILLIFEGFDEIDLSGDTDARVGHFRSLWTFNHENAKIIITGRPNFFLDSDELKRSLGDDDHSHTLYLAPFDLPQIEQSLRCVDSDVGKEILTLATKDPKFSEVVSRPSLLYIVAVLWQRENLSVRENISSAYVMDLFIKHTLQRQQKKHDERKFMVLNSAERLYFMSCIAVYMATNDLPNQITSLQLAEVVEKGIEIMPDSVSRSVTSVNNEEYLPLGSQERLDWQNKREDSTNRINNDVRTCGLLVTDLSKDGTFKFAHKSFMEFLQAQVVNDVCRSNEKGKSIANTWKMGITQLQYSAESMGFLTELLKGELHKHGVKEDEYVANRLFETLVIAKLSTKTTFESFFGLLACKPAISLINLFQIKQHESDDRKFILSVSLLFIFNLSLVMASTSSPSSSAIVLFYIGLLGFYSLLVSMNLPLVEIGKSTTRFQELLLPICSFILLVILIVFIVSNVGVDLLNMATIIFLLPIINSPFLIIFDYRNQRKTHFSVRLDMWFNACQNLKIEKKSMEKVVGKTIVASFIK